MLFRASFPQQFDDIRVALFFCNPEWGKTQRLAIGVRTFSQQHPHHFKMPVFGGDQEWRETVVGFGINRSAFLQQ